MSGFPHFFCSTRALLLSAALLLAWTPAALAQQDGAGGGEQPGAHGLVPIPKAPKPVSYYLRRPSAPIPEALRDRLPAAVLDRIEKRRGQLRGGLPAQGLSAPKMKAIGGIPEVSSSQSWVLNDNPRPRLNFDLTGTPRRAGDVDGDGTNDYLYATFARDERTPDSLEDVTGKTALFYGGAPPETEDQLIYKELHPVGDLNGDGNADAIQFEDGSIRFWAGSTNGYIDTGTTTGSSFANLTVAGFTDLDGDGFGDALLFRNFRERQFSVVYGAGSFSDAIVQTYVQNPGNVTVTLAAADLDDDGSGSVVRLAGQSPEMQVQLFEIEDDRTLTLAQNFVAEELERDADDNQLSLIDITGNDSLEVATTYREVNSPIYVFSLDVGGTLDETPVTLGKDDAIPVGDLDGDGRHDFYTFEEGSNTRYISYGPSDLSQGLTFDTEISYESDFFGRPGFVRTGGLGDVTDDGRPDAALDLTSDVDETVGRRFFSVNSDRTGRTPEDVMYPTAHFFDWIPVTEEIGDFNGDGVEDFVMVRNDLQQIEVFYGGSPISGEPDLTIESPINEEYFYLASGDFNGDGEGDIAAISRIEQLEIYLGGSGADGQADRVISADDLSGFNNLFYLHTIGDVNDDGAEDLIAADFFEGQQKLAVFFGGTPLPSVPGETIQYMEGFAAGRSAAAPGDANGDGIDDFVVGRSSFSGQGPGEGQADVYFGETNPSFASPDRRLRPSKDVGGFSSGLTGGDFNGDGIGDIAVRPDFSFEADLQVSVFFGGSNMNTRVDARLPIPAATGVGRDFNGDGSVDLLSGLQEPVGDIDGNGADELVLGTYFSGTNALLYRLTADSSTARVLRAPNQDEGMGYFNDLGDVAAGDFTDDGTTDVVFSQNFDNNDAATSSRVYRYSVSLASSPPPAPAGLRAVSTNQQNEIQVAWNAVGTGGLDGYHLYRSTAPFTDPKGSGVTRLTDSSLSDTSFVDSGLGDGTTYYYRATAVDASGNEGPVSVDGKETTEGLVAFASTSVDSSGTYGFGDTGVSLNFTGVSGSATVTIQRYAGQPDGTEGIDLNNVSDVRFVIDGGGLSFDSSEVRLPVSELTGVSDPSNVTMYERPNAGSGTFASLETTASTGGTPNDISDDTLQAATDTFSEFALASDTEPLPVELAGFEARVDGEKVRLSWTTASETNNAGFQVQRRAGTKTSGGEDAWETVGRVDGSGTTTEVQTYRFTDENLPYEADRLTYRLRQVDTDGSASYSNPVTVERSVDAVELLDTYPNPVQNRATVRYALPETQEVSLRLYDVLGREVRTIVRAEQEGRHMQRVDLSKLPSGVYFLRLASEGTARTQKLTVVR